MKAFHIADLHLGFQSGSKRSDTGRNLREMDVELAAEEVVQHAEQGAPDLILIAGDVFHTARPSNAAIRAAVSFTMRLAEVAPVCIVAGEHDLPLTTDSRCILDVLAEIPNVHVATREVRLVNVGCAHIAMVPRPVATAETLDQLANDDSVPSNVPFILLMHGMVFDDELAFLAEKDRVGAVAAADVPEAFDYVALGHYHIRKRVGPAAWYAGSIEHTSADLWRFEGDNEKGILEVEFSGTDLVSAEPIQLRTTRMIVAFEPIDAEKLSAAEVMERIEQNVERIGGVVGKLVRQVIINCSPATRRSLDRARIRQLQHQAVLFSLDIHTVGRDVALGEVVARGAQNVDDAIRAALAAHQLPPNVDRDEFVQLGLSYSAEEV